MMEPRYEQGTPEKKLKPLFFSSLQNSSLFVLSPPFYLYSFFNMRVVVFICDLQSFSLAFGKGSCFLARGLKIAR